MTTPSPAIPREKFIQHDDRDSGILPLQYLQLLNIYECKNWFLNLNHDSRAGIWCFEQDGWRWLASSCICCLQPSLKCFAVPTSLLTIGNRPRQLFHLFALLPRQPPQLLLPSSQRSSVPALPLIICNASRKLLRLPSHSLSSGLLIEGTLPNSLVPVILLPKGFQLGWRAWPIDGGLVICQPENCKIKKKRAKAAKYYWKVKPGFILKKEMFIYTFLCFRLLHSPFSTWWWAFLSVD